VLRNLAITTLMLQANTMTKLIEVAGLEQVRTGAGSRFVVADKEMAIFHVDGKICAIADTCPHAGGSLGMGKLNGTIVTCPVHGMKFDVTTGCFAGTSDFGVAAYPAKVVDGKIMVSVSEDA
jgi:3-phenylpropionate/trans-cinnamate dioxygenase ferredoxin subunit